MILITSVDQYNDSMATAIAFSCGFSLAMPMLKFLLISHAVQLLAALCAAKKALDATRDEMISQGKEWFHDENVRCMFVVDTLVNVSPEALDNAARFSEFEEKEAHKAIYGEDQGPLYTPDQYAQKAAGKVWRWWNSHTVVRHEKHKMHLAHERSAGRRATKAALAIMKLLRAHFSSAAFPLGDL